MEGLGELLRNTKVSSVFIILTLAATSYYATYVDGTTPYFPADINLITHGNYSWTVYMIGMIVFALQLSYETKSPYIMLYFLVFKDPILLLCIFRCVPVKPLNNSASVVIIIFSFASLFALAAGYFFANNEALSLYNFLMARGVTPMAFRFLRVLAVANWFITFLVINEL